MEESRQQEAAAGREVARQSEGAAVGVGVPTCHVLVYVLVFRLVTTGDKGEDTRDKSRYRRKDADSLIEGKKQLMASIPLLPRQGRAWLWLTTGAAVVIFRMLRSESLKQS